MNINNTIIASKKLQHSTFFLPCTFTEAFSISSIVIDSFCDLFSFAFTMMFFNLLNDGRRRFSKLPVSCKNVL